MHLYHYVGPRQIADRFLNVPTGTPVGSARDVVRWARESGQHPTRDGCVIATFVVDPSGSLLLADRRSEHVACLVAAVEIVSPRNKDRVTVRDAFVSKCHALLHEGVCVAIVDPVTTRLPNLYAELAERIGARVPATAEAPLYAVT